MSVIDIGRRRIHYRLEGAQGQPVLVFLNGLTQNARLWDGYAQHFTGRGFQVLTYDMLGQGLSDKPILGIGLQDHADLLAGLLDALQIERVHLAGISFGGIIALDFAVRHGERLHSLVVMSALSELTPQLEHLGAVMLQGLVEVGLPYLQSLLYPMNMSSRWLEANRETIPEMKRRGYIGNDAFAMQNLMESFVDFEPLTPYLPTVQVPTLLINGEHDFFTPRACHETMRAALPNCRLLIMPHAYHAFTLEMPALTVRQLDHFLDLVLTDLWRGDQSVWIAAEDLDAGAPWLPCSGDWTRAVHVETTATPAQRRQDRRQPRPKEAQ